MVACSAWWPVMKNIFCFCSIDTNRLNAMMDSYSHSAAARQVATKLSLSPHNFIALCTEAVSTFMDIEWVPMHEISLILINNAFQASDPQLYPQNDKSLRMMYDVLTTVLFVNRLMQGKLPNQ